jgi:cobyrinic acid a,c-diamide synthase
MQSASSPPGIIIAAPASGSGKTTITLALLRALRNRGVRVGSMKIGPDYIDPKFHHMASGRECINLDDWAMSAATFEHALARAGEDADLIIAEGVMGLFDGSGTGRGSTADVAARLAWPVILVLDVSGMAASAAAMAKGFIEYRDDVQVAGVILNRLGGDKHRQLIEEELSAAAIPLMGALERRSDLALPSRHLGLVQATEHSDLNDFIERAAQWLTQGVDLDRFISLASPGAATVQNTAQYPLAPLGQRITIARDAAFGFSYPLTIDGWREQGAEISFYSPLANEAPSADADAVFLPGGYPELHAGKLSVSKTFINGVQALAAQGATIYGECGGFMVLGEALHDGEGEAHAMCGLLPLTTSFESPRMTLGYRQVEVIADSPLGPSGQRYRGHEFHFAHIVRSDDSTQALFQAQSATGDELGTAGLCKGSVLGSFIHLVDRAG